MDGKVARAGKRSHETNQTSVGLIGFAALGLTGCVHTTRERVVVEKQPVIEKKETTIIERR